MEKSSKPTVEQIPVTSTKQTTLVGGRVQQLTPTVEQPRLKTLDLWNLPAVRRLMVWECFDANTRVHTPAFRMLIAQRTGEY